MFCVAALVGGIVPGPGHDIPDDLKTIELGLVRGLIHYDLLLPNTPQTREELGWLQPQGIDLQHPQAEWVVVGWGSRAFYTTAGTYRSVRASSVWTALTGDSAVLRLSISGGIPENMQVRTIKVTPGQYQAILTGINQSFRFGKGTQALPLPGFSAYDRFFPASGRFSLFNTCNVWLGNLLRSAGVDFGIWTPTPFAVTLSHRLWHKDQRVTPRRVTQATGTN